MTLPGILPGSIALRPLSYLSPSRYASFEYCTLRGVLAGCGTSALLPLAPSARLGTAIHRLLEEASAGLLVNRAAETIRSRWRDLVDETEQEMLNSWMERHFVPLRRSVRDFEVRRLRAFELAAQIAETASPRGTAAAGPRGTGCELWVRSKSGLVRGRIDSAQRTSEGIVIRDYKTGNVYESESAANVLKKEYEVQLKVYAALYAETFDVWPSRMEIAMLTGEVLTIPVEPTECQEQLLGAEAALRRINRILSEDAFTSSASRLAGTLARPSQSACARCEYRPACVAYQSARVAMEAIEWPEDLFGELQDIRQLSNGKLVLVINHDSRCHAATVRALTADVHRHPGLHGAQPGTRLSLFNLRADNTSCSFSEIPATTIYQSP